jgi:hypothetical protein
MPEHRRELTKEQRAQRRAQDREYARRAVERLRSSDGWNAWLTARASFRNYTKVIWRASVLGRKESAGLRRRHVIKRLRPDLLSARRRGVGNTHEMRVEEREQVSVGRREQRQARLVHA